MRDGAGRALDAANAVAIAGGVADSLPDRTAGQRLMDAHARTRREGPAAPTPRRSRTTRRRSTRSVAARAGRSATSALAERLGVSPGTVTAMLKRMAELGLVEHAPYHGVALTAAGERVALEVIRHHRLIEAYLAEALGMPWDQVHDEAEVLEHYISEDLEERIASALGDPSHDPHGDPIPDRELWLVEDGGGVALAELEIGRCGGLRARLRLRPGDAALPRRAWRSSGRRADGRRSRAVRRPADASRSEGASTRSGRRLWSSDSRSARRERVLSGAPPQAKLEPSRTDPERLLEEREVEAVLPGEAAVARAARRSLDGHSRGLARVWPFLGPAFIAAVAYIDPGNFATNIAGGAPSSDTCCSGSSLAANLIAMLIQTQSAKLGIATGRNLPELCREQFSRRTSIGLWLQAEVVAMSTDIAEVVGAALGPQPAVRDPAVSGRADRRRRRLRDPRPAGDRLSPAGGRDRRARRRRAALLRVRDRPRRARSPARWRPTCSCRGSAAPRASCWRRGSSAPR